MTHMTLAQLRALPKEWLSPKDVSGVLRCDPYSLNVTVKNGGQLPFPYLMCKTRLKIPRRAFIAWAEEMRLDEED